MSATLTATLAGLAFGFGMASVAYLRVFTNTLKELHEDNIETARLLVQGDRNRATDVAKTADDLIVADEKVVRKVKNGDRQSSTL